MHGCELKRMSLLRGCSKRRFVLLKPNLFGASLLN